MIDSVQTVQNATLKKFFVLLATMAGLAIFFAELPPAEARHIVRWYGPSFNYGRWRGGYWYHGAWGPRVGWWWVVGPTWYYYAEPVYPYPPAEVAPVYFVDAGSPPPPTASSPSA